MNEQPGPMSRRNFLSLCAAGTVGMACSGLTPSVFAGNYPKCKVSVFSKHLQWLDYEAMAELAAEIGFDGVDLTVRPKGHVLPERVDRDLPRAVDAVRKAGSVGFPTLHLDTRLVDADGREVGPDQVGELRRRGPTVCAGYWGNKAATGAARRDGGWFATGDLFRRDEEGYHLVVGRLKEMFISGGENVYPAEIERVLYDVPEVTEAAVVGIPDPRWGEVGHAFVAYGPGAVGPDGDAILTLCRERLARYKVPKRLTVLPELPKGSSGKIQKRDLQEMAHDCR